MSSVAKHLHVLAWQMGAIGRHPLPQVTHVDDTVDPVRAARAFAVLPAT